jgi:hypothetical protein
MDRDSGIESHVMTPLQDHTPYPHWILLDRVVPGAMVSIAPRSGPRQALLSGDHQTCTAIWRKHEARHPPGLDGGRRHRSIDCPQVGALPDRTADR